MPYSFTQIEQDKTRTIGFVFAFLILFYFFSALGVILIAKNYFLLQMTERDYAFAPKGLAFHEMFYILVGAGIAAAIHWLVTVSGLVPKILKVLGAEPINPKDTYHQMFKNICDEVAVATGGKKIEPVVVPVLAMNAFALADFEGRSVIGVTEGLLSRLSRPQIEAVVGHEAAHIVSGDCLSTTVTSSIFAMYNGILDGISKVMRSENRSYSSRRGGGGIFLFLGVIYLFLSVTKVLSFLVKMFVSREREFRADAVAVRLTRDPLSLAEALYGISRRWRGGGLASEDMDAIFIMNPQFSRLDESNGFFADLFSTHPPVQKRLEVLLDMAKTDVKELEANFQKRENRPRSVGGDAQPAYQDAEIQNILNKGASDSSMLCPHCNVALMEVHYEGLPLLKCGQCGGILITESDVQRVIIREDVGFSERVIHMAKAVDEMRQKYLPPLNRLKGVNLLACPRCRDPKPRMLKTFYSLVYPVEVERCVFCQSVWLDKDELEVLQYLIEKAQKEK